MEVKTISWNKTITAEIALNVDTIEYKDQQVFELPFTISGGDGSNYHGKIEQPRNYQYIGNYQYYTSCTYREGRIQTFFNFVIVHEIWLDNFKTYLSTC